MPERVIIAGDWHRNTPWAAHVIREAARLVPAEMPRVIIHLGDFGILPGLPGRAYLRAVRDACQEHGVVIRFLDGNHEDFTQLEGLRMADWGGAPVAWIPRGHRWQWHGRTWLALGGGVSLDRATRAEGRDWWPQEEVTADEAAAVTAGGPADVMLAHDCPSGVRHSFPPPASFWDDRDLARDDVHRERLQLVAGAVRPQWLMHGHLHRAYQRRCDLGYGPVEVTGLDRDGGRGPNYALLDVRAMTWEGAW